MGCDIHVHVEKRGDASLPWERVEDLVPNPEFKYASEDYPQPERVRDSWYRDRDYTLFGALAGVRSVGPPISEPRGVPEDACEETQQAKEFWGWDGHSHSHLDLDELLAYDWEGHDILDREDFRYADSFGHLLLRLQELVGPGAGKNVRLVFWFDN